MNRREYEKYLSEAYGVTGENPWRDSPTNTVSDTSIIKNGSLWLWTSIKSISEKVRGL